MSGACVTFKAKASEVPEPGPTARSHAFFDALSERLARKMPLLFGRALPTVRHLPFLPGRSWIVTTRSSLVASRPQTATLRRWRYATNGKRKAVRVGFG